MTATCDFRFSLQGRYADQSFVEKLLQLGVTNAAVTVPGRALVGGKTTDAMAFVAATTKDIRAKLGAYLDAQPPRADDLVILDLEPKGAAPAHLGTFAGPAQRRLVAAYVRRFRIARQKLQETGVPGLRLGLYQVIVPDGRGRLSERFATSLCGYIAAGRGGMYDELDFICPVLYQRFGPKDTTPGTLRAWIDASTQQAIDGSLALARSDGTPVPLVPILSFWVFNGNSQNNRDAVAPRGVARQLEIVQGATGIEAIVFWSGLQTEDLQDAKKPLEQIDLIRFLTRTGTLPWPGCT